MENEGNDQLLRQVEIVLVLKKIVARSVSLGTSMATFQLDDIVRDSLRWFYFDKRAFYNIFHKNVVMKFMIHDNQLHNVFQRVKSGRI